MRTRKKVKSPNPKPLLQRPPLPIPVQIYPLILPPVLPSPRHSPEPNVLLMLDHGLRPGRLLRRKLQPLAALPIPELFQAPSEKPVLVIEPVDFGVSSALFEIRQVAFLFFFDDDALVFGRLFPDEEVRFEEVEGVRVECVAVRELVDEGRGLEEDVEEGVD